jgi:ABC-type antimicrobial peptide transport system permease subunit
MLRRFKRSAGLQPGIFALATPLEAAKNGFDRCKNFAWGFRVSPGPGFRAPFASSVSICVHLWFQGFTAGTLFALLLIGVFAVIAALLAGVGLYGLLSTVVRQRTAEIGVRMALGSQPGGIFNLVVGQELRLTAVGIAAGLVAAFALTRLMATMLVGVKATDPATFVTMAILFFLIAAVASWLPAWRAASVDPNAALHQQ